MLICDRGALFERHGRLIVVSGQDGLETKCLKESLAALGDIESQFFFDETIGSGAVVNSSVTGIENNSWERVQGGSDAPIEGGLGIGSHHKGKASEDYHNSHTWHRLLLHRTNLAQI